MTDHTDDTDKTTGKRGRKPSPEAVRKDRIIQTRVPKDLESTLKDAAERERVSVSQLIRHVLEDTFTLVDGIVSDSANLIDHVARDARQLAESAKGFSAKHGDSGKQDKATAQTDEALDNVEAWQEVIVNKPVKCQKCATELGRGTKAFRGVSSVAGAAPVWLCAECINNL